MRFKTAIIFSLTLLLNNFAYADGENCTPAKKTSVCLDEVIKERVNWACKLVEEKGKVAIVEINKMRYDCCGEPNYVWINDTHPRMINHPIKTNMNGMDLSNEKDPSGKKLFVEFVEAGKKAPNGSWVDYEWTRFGETTASPKKSWIRACTPKGAKEPWIVGSGSWK